MSLVPLRPVLAALYGGESFTALTAQVSKERSWLSDTKTRLSARQLNEMPSLFFNLDSHPDMDGSAIFTIGESRVSVGVVGPTLRALQSTAQGTAQLSRKEKDRGIVKIRTASRSEAVLEVSIQQASFATTNSEKTLESFLSRVINPLNTEVEDTQLKEQTLVSLAEAVMEVMRSTIRTAAYPHSAITVFVTVLRNDGSDLLPCILNALSLALMRAGVSLTDVLASAAAYTVELPGEKPVVCLSLDGMELDLLRRQHARISTTMLGVLCNSRRMAYISLAGQHLHNPYDEQMQAFCESACIAIGNELGSCIRDNLPEADGIGAQAV